MKPIKNILNLGVYELLHEITNADYWIQYADIDLYNHIRRNTNNFEPDLMAMMNNTLQWFAGMQKIKDVADNSYCLIDVVPLPTPLDDDFKPFLLSSKIIKKGDDWIKKNIGADWESVNTDVFKSYVEIYEEIIKDKNIDIANYVTKLQRYSRAIRPFETYLKPEHRNKKNKLIQLIKTRLHQLKDVDIVRIYNIVMEYAGVRTDSNNAIFTSFCKELDINFVEKKPTNPKGKYIVRKTLTNATNETALYNHPKLESEIRKLFS